MINSKGRNHRNRKIRILDRLIFKSLTMKKYLTTSALIVLFSIFIQSSCGQDDGWIDLFDGKTLNGWSIHSGTATYRVEDGTIVGTTAQGSPNTFLCTDREFSDFILEFEVFLKDPELNSGVQFRSKIAPEELTYWLRNDQGEMRPRTVPEDRVHGYQVEIASSETGTSGGIYDEARRAMIRDWWIEKGTEASKAFKDGEWNKYRVECKGQSIKTWVNGIPTADIKDAMTLSGIIGLQVHGIGDNPSTYEVMWRNIRIQELSEQL